MENNNKNEIFKICKELKALGQKKSLTQEDIIKFKKRINEHINFFPENDDSNQKESTFHKDAIAIPKPHFFERKGFHSLF